MKYWWKKVLFTDDPAQRAFAGFTLLLAACWIVPALILRQGGFPPNEGPFRLGLFTCLCLAGWLAAAICALIAWGRFYSCRPWMEKTSWTPIRSKVISLSMTLSSALLVWISILCSPTAPSLAFAAGAAVVLLFAFFWIPLMKSAENWKIILLRGLCLLAAIGSTAVALAALEISFSEEFFRNSEGYFDFIDTAWLYPAAFGAVLLWIPAYLLTAYMYAKLAQIPFRQIFSRTVVIILCFWAGVYLVSLGMAYAAGRRTERTVAELEKKFGRPLTIPALYRFYRNGRPVDEKFWQELRSTIVKFEIDENAERHDLLAPFACFPAGIYPESMFRIVKKIFEQSGSQKRLAKLLDRSFPARKYELTGDLHCFQTSELGTCETLCGWELLRIRFALADGKTADACAAAGRLKRISEYLGSRPSGLTAAILMERCEKYRMRGLELQLSYGQVPEPMLKQWLAELEKDEKAVPELFSDVLYAEAVFSNHFLNGMASGRPRFTGKPFPGLYGLRLLYPPLWHFCTLERNRIMKVYQIRGFDEDAREMAAPSIRGKDPFLLRSVVKGIEGFTAQYRAMRALIEVELEKRRTGKYPDTLKNPPVDPFTGKPMVYRKGRFRATDPVWNAEKKDWDLDLVQEFSGVGIISSGPYSFDEIRAVLTVSPADRKIRKVDPESDLSLPEPLL